MSTQNAGIDYGMGTTNIDHGTGIRYGVIPARDVGQAWYDGAEPDYGEATCPKCGNPVSEMPTHTESSDPPGQWVAIIYDIPDYMDEWERAGHESEDYYCESCKYIFGSESAFPESPNAFTYTQDGYEATQNAGDYASSDDIFITLSPYYTYAGFCSPCAPGAGYLRDAFEGTKEEAENAGFPKVYCFGHDWFEDEKAPYLVYSVETGELIPPKEE